MADFELNVQVIANIADITNPHMKALNIDITKAFPEQPDMAYTVAMGFAVSVLLASFSDPETQMSVVDGVNFMVKHQGFALTPVN